MSAQTNGQLKTAAIVVVATLFTGSVLAGGYVVYQKREARIARDTAQLVMLNERALQAISSIGKYSDEEQKLIEGSVGEPERLRLVLVRLHTSRITFWESKKMDLDSRIENFKKQVQLAVSQGEYTPTIKRVAMDVADKLDKERNLIEANLAGYNESLTKLEKWKPFATIQEAELANKPEEQQTDIRRM